jgi:hypothetical protein
MSPHPRYLRLAHVLDELRVERELIDLLEADDLIRIKQSSEGEPVLSAEDAERVRVAHLLTTELEVNLAGAEVVLHMRDEIIAMQRQFAEILESLLHELRQRFPR